MAYVMATYVSEKPGQGTRRKVEKEQELFN